MWVKRKPHKYVACHAAHAGRTTNKGDQSGAGCKNNTHKQQQRHRPRKNKYVTCHAMHIAIAHIAIHNAVPNTIHKKMARRQVYGMNRAMVEAYRKCAHMRAKAPPQHAHSRRGYDEAGTRQT